MSPVLKPPLEILTSHRVEWSDTLERYKQILKVQVFAIDPLDLQFVPELWPKHGRTKLPDGEKPRPQAYYHVRQADAGQLERLAELALASRLLFANSNRAPSKTELVAQLEAWMALAKNTIAEAAYYALETIQRHDGGSSK